MDSRWKEVDRPQWRARKKLAGSTETIRFRLLFDTRPALLWEHFGLHALVPTLDLFRSWNSNQRYETLGFGGPLVCTLCLACGADHSTPFSSMGFDSAVLQSTFHSLWDRDRSPDHRDNPSECERELDRASHLLDDCCHLSALHCF